MNKKTGIIRYMDKLGRIVIPKEIRNQLNINDLVEINIEKNSIYINKLEYKCIFCNSVENVGKFKNKFICRECILKIKNI